MGCSNSPDLQDINYENGLAYIDGNLFSGEASDYFDEDAAIKKSMVFFEDGKTIKKAYYSENGDLVADEIFSNNKISLRNNYLKGSIFIVKDFNKETIKVNDILCEEECVYENVALEDIVISGTTFKNVTFKNSTFRNVTFEGSEYTPDGVVFLDNFKIIDSSLESIKFRNNIITASPYNDYQDKTTASNILFDNVTGRIEVQINRDESARIFLNIINSEIEEFTLTNRVDRRHPKSIGGRGWTCGKCHLDLYLKTEDSTFKNFSFISFAGEAHYENTPILEIKNTVIDTLDGLVIGRQTRDLDGRGPIENGFSCENSEFKGGNLLMIADYCDDMDIVFDEYAVQDFEKSYSPDLSNANLAKYAIGKPVNYKNFTVSVNNSEKQRHALGAGDTEFLEKYILHIYKGLMKLGDVQPSGKFYAISKCADTNLFEPGNKYPPHEKECHGETFSTLDFITWESMPKEFRSGIDELQKELILGTRSQIYTQTVFEDGIRRNLTRKEKAKYPNLSTPDRELLAEKFVDHYYDFSNLKNCYRGKEAREAITLLTSVGLSPPKISESYHDRYLRVLSTMHNKEVSNSNAVSKFRECIEGNISIYSSQNIDAYSNISRIASNIEQDISLYLVQVKRKEEEIKNKRKEKREKVYAEYLKNGAASGACDALVESEGYEMINYYFSGSREEKIARAERAQSACYRCFFDLFSRILSEEDFNNFVDGKAWSGMGMGDYEKSLMCMVAGADRNVKELYRKKILPQMR